MHIRDFSNIHIFMTISGERQVIHFGGATRDQGIHNLFQIADVDSGVIRWVNVDLVTHVIPDW